MIRCMGRALLAVASGAIFALASTPPAADAEAISANPPLAANSSSRVTSAASRDGGRPAPDPQPRSGAGGRASSGQPLIHGPTSPTNAAMPEEGATVSVEPETDPLVANGLGSPLCSPARGSELAETSRQNCETSGFVAAAAPTNDYGLDVHIDTGVLGLSSGGLLSAVQDLFVAPLWMAIVWLVHALVVMLEWCFQIDLLDSSASGGLGRNLREVQAVLTQPWLAIVLSVAAVVAAYNGLVRRRVSEALGETALMGVMMVGGMSVILDPTGTIGAVGRWANQASLGTLAVTASGTSAGPERTLGESMGTVFSAAIEAPWCYLEFGDVSWCRERRRLDPALRGAALKIAAREQTLSACSKQGTAGSCAGPGGSQIDLLKHSAELLRDADTNGAIFLALPANGPARNSINEEGSLLRTLCHSSEATACRGFTAAEAEFRTNSGTWARVGGLLLIVAGVLGMLLLLGFIALRLLASAVLALMYLLLAPAAVLAPALGEAGRAAFGVWSSRLLGAVVSKLIYSFVLGTVLAVAAVPLALRGLGWWTQWLLMSAFWWSVYLRRHLMLGLVEGRAVSGRLGARRSSVQRMTDTVASGRAAIRAAGLGRQQQSKPAPDVEKRRPPARAPGKLAIATADEQAGRSLRREYTEAQTRVDDGVRTEARLSELRRQLQRVRGQQARASATGDRRRMALLESRASGIAHGISSQEEGLRDARRVTARAERTRRRTGSLHTPEQLEEQGRLLDAQAALPAGARHNADGERRDYVALAGLAGYGRDEYKRLDPVARRSARLQIDRELALRRGLAHAATDTVRSSPADARSHRPPGERAIAGDFDGGRGGRPRLDEGRTPASGADNYAAEATPGPYEGRAGVSARGQRSSVMQDALEVAARRKRQLGSDRP